MLGLVGVGTAFGYQSKCSGKLVEEEDVVRAGGKSDLSRQSHQNALLPQREF